MKCTNFVGPFDPFRRPAPGRPPGSKNPWGPRFGWYTSGPGASRKGEYPKGSNIKNIRFVKKCTNFVGPFDPFRQPSPGRPPGTNYPWEPRLGWYRSCPGSSRGGEYLNGSNIMNIRLWWNASISLVHLTHSDGLPQDDLQVPSTNGDLDLAGISPILGQAVGANIQTGPTSKMSVLWWNALISLVHLTHSDGLPKDDLLVPNTHGDLDWAGIVPVLGQAVGCEYPNGSNIKNTRFVMKCTNFVCPFDQFRRPAPGRPPGSKHPWVPRLGWYRSRPGASRRGEYPNGSNIKNIRFVMKCTKFFGPFDPFRGLPEDDLLVASTHENLSWAGIGPVLGQAVGANSQRGQTSRISVLWRNAPISLVHLTHSGGQP